MVAELLTTAHTAQPLRDSTAVSLSLFRGRGYGIPVHSKGVPGMLPTTKLTRKTAPNSLIRTECHKYKRSQRPSSTP